MKMSLLFFLCGCSPASTSNPDLSPKNDSAAANDLASAADLAAVRDLAAADLAAVRDLQTADLEAPIVTHSILPSDTDPATSSPDDPHLTWAGGAGNGRILVFFPGSGAKTSAYTTFLGFAASTGYHVIDLGYPNQYGSMSTICGTDTACYGEARTELWSGKDTSSKIAVDESNCIHHRLDKLFAYLTARYPEESWDTFYYQGEPAWNKLTASGHSQGGGHAAFVASMFRVARVAMFSAVSDASNGTSPPTAADWLLQPHATPSERYFGFDHVNDTAYHAKILVDWPLLGMTGALTDVDSELAPYGNSQQLTSSRTLISPHNQVVANSVPLVNGVPVYEDAWRYLIGP